MKNKDGLNSDGDRRKRAALPDQVKRHNAADKFCPGLLEDSNYVSIRLRIVPIPISVSESTFQ
jgi:hypothetical protein